MLSLSWERRPSYYNIIDHCWLQPYCEGRQKSLEGIPRNYQALGALEKFLFLPSQQWRKVLPGDNVDRSFPIDCYLVHLEEMGCPGAGAYLATVAFMSVNDCDQYITLT